jgi:hypothetical protein
MINECSANALIKRPMRLVANYCSDVTSIKYSVVGTMYLDIMVEIRENNIEAVATRKRDISGIRDGTGDVGENHSENRLHSASYQNEVISSVALRNNGILI